MKPISENQRGSRERRAPRALRVVAPGRLHIGFLDLNGSLGRRFGSIGLAVDRPALRLRVETTDEPRSSGPDSDRAAAAIAKLAACDSRIDGRLSATVEEALPAHAGLGSGTQLALAAGFAAAKLSGVDMTPAEVSRALHRGVRSSIGLAAFEGGGVLLDGGQPVTPDPADHRPPPLVSRIPAPEAWRILLIFDQSRSGLSGREETAAMGGLPEFPEELSGRLCRLALMGAMPAAAMGDAAAFGRAVGEMQRRLGDHFAQFQGGRFTSPDVAEALAVIEAEGVPGVGQSSWGPTGFAVFGEAEAAEEAAADLRARFATKGNLDFAVARGNNRGATVADIPPDRSGD